VAGVWRDYARQSGSVVIDIADYQRLTGDLLRTDAACGSQPAPTPHASSNHCDHHCKLAAPNL